MQIIFQFIGLILLLILSFLGGNYMLSGDIIISGSASVVLVIVMFFLIEYMKKRKIHISKSKFSATSLLLWILFVSICVPIGVLMSHALNVEVNAKKEIQSYAKNIILKNQEVVNLFQTENQQYIAETYLIARNLLDNYVNTTNQKQKDSIKEALENVRFSITNLGQVNRTNYMNNANALQTALEIKSQAILDSIQDRTKSTLKNSFHLINNWSRLRIVSALIDMENMLEKNVIQMNRFLTNENDKPNVFNKADPSTTILEITQENNTIFINKLDVQLSSFTALWVRYNSYWLVLPVLVFFFFLLIPYFLEKTAGIYLESHGEKEDEEGGIEL